MANAPSQFPRFDLPGAEYFSLAPNANVAIQGRRRISLSPANTNAPASTNNVNAQTTLILENTFTPTSGVYVHRFFVVLQVSAAGLQVATVFAGLSQRTDGFPMIPLGNPTLTNPTINIGTTVLLDRDVLITSRDILAMNVGAGAGTLDSNLRVTASLNVNNPTVSAINFNATIGILYTRLDGLTE